MTTTLGGVLLRTAHEASINPEAFRKTLLVDGVPKGTASKAVTILKALADGRLKPSQVTSLSRGYELVKRRNIQNKVMELMDQSSLSATTLEELNQGLYELAILVGAVSRNRGEYTRAKEATEERVQP